MRANPARIAVLFRSEADRRLLRAWLHAEGFLVVIPGVGEGLPTDLADVDLILVEASVAQELREELLDWKRRASAAFSFLPILVAQPYPEPAGPWLAAGFDDVIPLPIVKSLLSVRIRTWLRIREDTVGRFRALVEECAIGFYRTTPDGRILYANPALVRMLGFASFPELAQHNLEELAQRSGYPRSRFKELLEKHGQVLGFESAWTKPDGRVVWMRESAHVVRDEFGRALYYEGTVEDITEKVEAQEAYFTVVEHSLQGMAILQDGRVVFGNPALAELCGRSLAELMAMSPEEVLAMVHPEDRPRVAENMRRRLAGEPVPPVSEFRFIHKAGSVRWVRALARRIEFAGRPALLVSYLDITEERRLAERLAAVGEFGRRLVFARTPQEVARSAVEGACAILGLTDVSLFVVDEEQKELVLLAHSFQDPPDPLRLPLDSDKGVVVRAFRTGRTQNIPDVAKEPAYLRAFPENRAELALPLKVGEKVVGVLNVESTRPAAFGPEEERILTALANVTAVALENVRLFSTLERLKTFHETIVQALAEGVVLVDAQYRITFANPAAAQLLGYAPSELLGKAWQDVVAPAFWGVAEEEGRRRARGEEGVYELLLVRKDGSTLPALVRARPLFEGERFVGSLKAFTDVSLLKEFETRYRYFAEQTEEGFYRLELRKPLPPSLSLEEQVEHILTHAVIKEVNDAFARPYGLSRGAELVGRNLRELYGGEVPAGVRELVREFLAQGARLTGREIELPLPNGETRWFSYTAVGLYVGKELQSIWGTQRDVTARRRAEEGLKRQLHRLTVLHRVSQEIVRALANPEGVYEAVHRAVAELMPAEAFVIVLKRSDNQAEAVYLFDKGGRFPAQTIPKGQGLTWYVLSTGKPVLVGDLAEEKLPAIHFGTKEPVRSVLAVPLRVEGETMGMLSTQSYQPNAFGEEDLRLLELLAAHVAVALRSAQLLLALRESEARFRRLAENAPDIIYRYQLKPVPRFEYVSPAATRIVGYTPEEHYADPELGLKTVHPEDRPKLEALPRGEFLGKPVELRWIHKAGHIVWTEQVNIPVFDEQGELVAIEGIARDITDRKRAEEERLSWAKTLERVFYQVVDAFASAMDLREPYTAGHQRRVAELACAIAEEMGWPAERVRGLHVAALLHDIGKALFVPIEILSKPGKLTELEMALIREHPKAGYEILKRVEFPWPVAEVVYQHHERLDGSGYPRRLRGDQILPEARILAVADVVEAMSSHRPYRPALGVEKALEEIQTHAGKLYDPTVVEACVRVFHQGFRFPKGSSSSSARAGSS